MEPFFLSNLSQIIFIPSSYHPIRHPDHTSRPSFLHLLRALTSSPSKLLSWSHEDTWGAADALILGAPLNTGEKLYSKLQDIYITKTDK